MKRTQTQKVIDYLATGRGLTPLRALRKFGTMRLGARIYDLRRCGHNIKSHMVKRGGATVAEYRLQA